MNQPVQYLLPDINELMSLCVVDLPCYTILPGVQFWLRTKTVPSRYSAKEGSGGIMEQSRKRWLGWSLVALLIIGMVTLHVLFEINRFSGECKHFRDSSGGFVKNENGETVYKCNAGTEDDIASHNNDTPRDDDYEALPIGRQSGPIGGVDRSLGVWVVSAVFYLIVSSLSFVLLGCRCCGRRRCGASSDDPLQLRNSVLRHQAVAEADIKQHSKELFRIVMIIYLCTVLAVAYKLLAIWMGIQCGGNAAHVLYSLLGGTTYVAQSKCI